jgi:hypothetical protein
VCGAGACSDARKMQIAGSEAPALNRAGFSWGLAGASSHRSRFSFIGQLRAVGHYFPFFSPSSTRRQKVFRSLYIRENVSHEPSPHPTNNAKHSEDPDPGHRPA